MMDNAKIEKRNGNGRNTERRIKETGKQCLDYALSIYSCVIQRTIILDCSKLP